MLLALTVERYISVCFPAKARNLCGATRRAHTTVALLPLVTFTLYSPYLFLADVIQCRDDRGQVVYMKQINESLTLSGWFNAYKWLMEISYKLLPAAVLFYLNIHIIYAYRAVCERRRRMTQTKVSGEQRRQYAEESRLMFLLGGTSAIFFICMTPMIALSVTVHFTHYTTSYVYQIFRALANVLEVTNFSVTFYIYCLFSKDFRETFFAFVRTATRTAVPKTYFASMSGFRETLRPP
ncbi:probable G-protein coupled receptor B0563.6 [Hyalella azteca]|uniref:Probable G-protein coupled receptor B0563.6 n=1 Tax=Hyalella azteca TaxID=294128 RepID=A0A8B7PEK9_HYAAZ|nr:probable G-protein coupled receptor B0563.6 [Hyalella azteca]